MSVHVKQQSAECRTGLPAYIRAIDGTRLGHVAREVASG